MVRKLEKTGGCCWPALSSVFSQNLVHAEVFLFSFLRAWLTSKDGITRVLLAGPGSKHM